ncbi:hypothetical protein [Paenibacillus luteus]|uniref:hypothetical protein n=1 Tax=Paenibacillus luteus TaxID=2545753 RepID=UPI0019D502E7|nr:hypothetical protein [Paenibacillus luteus]
MRLGSWLVSIITVSASYYSDSNFRYILAASGAATPRLQAALRNLPFSQAVE